MVPHAFLRRKLRLIKNSSQYKKTVLNIYVLQKVKID